MSSSLPPLLAGFYDPFSIYGRLRERLEKTIQLTNLHWRKSANDSLRSIPQLPLALFEEVPRIFDNNSNSPTLNIHELSKHELINSINKVSSTPFVRLMLIKCVNMDDYRGKVRPLIEEWLKSNVVKANAPVDWYIILYSESESDNKTQTRIYEKLRTDFNGTGISSSSTLSNTVTASLNTNLSTNDRIMKMNETVGTKLEESEIVNVFNTRLKTGVIHSFSSRLEIMTNVLNLLFTCENEIETEFRAYVVLKEAIASLFLKVHLFEDALEGYDDISQTVLKFQMNKHIFPMRSWNSKNVQTFQDYTRKKTVIDSGSDELPIFNLRILLFVKQFIVLESLSEASASLSIKSIHISEFLRRLNIVISDISDLFAVTPLAIAEWIYMVIDEILNLKVCSSLIQGISEDSETNMNEISERFGDLRLLQRKKLTELAFSQGFKLENITQTFNILLSDESYTIEDDKLVEVLKTQDSFEDKYIQLTEEAIKHYGMAGRPRSVDILSIDIALLDYQNKEYERAVSVLSTCPDFYQSEGWDFIGLHLLIVLIDCLENLNPEAEFFSPSSKNVMLAKYYLDYLRIITENEIPVPRLNSQNVLSKLGKLEAVEIPYHVNGLFDLSINNTVMLSDNDEYGLIITWKNKLGFHFELKDIKLYLMSEEGEVLLFEREELLLAGSIEETELLSHDISISACNAHNLTARFNNITFLYDFGTTLDAFKFYPSPYNTTLKIETSTDFDLDQKSFSVFIETGSSDIEDVKLEYHSNLNNIYLENKAKVLTNSSLKNFGLVDFDASTVTIPSIPKKSKYEISVPYTVTNTILTNSLDVKAKLSYVLNGVPKSQRISTILDTSLSIAVSVQDIFKNESLYAKFSIGTSESENPVYLQNVSMNGNGKFRVTKPLEPKSFVAFGKQPGSYFFKIDRILGSEVTKEEFLKLAVTYRNLRDEILSIFKEELRVRLRELSNFLNYIDLKAIKFDYQQFVLNSLVDVLEYNAHSCFEGLRSIAKRERLEIIRIFDEVVESNFKVQSDFTFPNRHLFINVQIPTVEVIHILELRLPEGLTYSVIGEAIPVMLSVTSKLNRTQEGINSSEKPKKRVLFAGEDSKIKKFDFEVLSNQDSWLINGLNKFSIELDKSSDKDVFKHPDIELSLIPFRTGKLQLPKLKVTSSNESKSDYSMEVDYKNDSETIHIVSDVS
ncbi:hypothetical protein WICMUC_003688 [Wickerhamomyces mucosus]|uniref:Trafficking protein particle complex II-specific subunit 130 n=1 Tax=Wickerhamomyces mucosus TaxID=1378264 RepID=A0A9P8TC70_9ASCO|nr:hypothetical protein WICMUC_003688 [Wickerhamomyces mucosus]